MDKDQVEKLIEELAPKPAFDVEIALDLCSGSLEPVGDDDEFCRQCGASIPIDSILLFCEKCE